MIEASCLADILPILRLIIQTHEQHYIYLEVSFKEILYHFPGVEKFGNRVLIPPLKIFQPLGWKIVTLGDLLQVFLPG